MILLLLLFTTAAAMDPSPPIPADPAAAAQLREEGAVRRLY